MATPDAIMRFRSRFAEFEDTTDPEIGNAIDLASQWNDSRVWMASDFPLAVQLWAAHFLTLKQMQEASSAVGGAGEMDLFVKGVTFGERHVELAERSGSASAEKMLGPGEELLSQTLYGQMYLTLRARNIVPVATV